MTPDLAVGSEPIISETSDPPPGSYLAMFSPLLQFNEAAVGDAHSEDFAILISHPDSGALLGGLWARSLWGAFYIDMMVVPEVLRGRGIGTRLMTTAEAEARRRGCHLIWLDTYDFQARSFYERMGFDVFGQLNGPAPVYPRFFMKKELG